MLQYDETHVMHLAFFNAQHTLKDNNHWFSIQFSDPIEDVNIPLGRNIAAALDVFCCLSDIHSKAPVSELQVTSPWFLDK